MKRVVIECRVYEMTDEIYDEFRNQLDLAPRVDETIEWDNALGFGEKNGKYLFDLDGDFHY
jgi:hypothetical protein